MNAKALKFHTKLIMLIPKPAKANLILGLVRSICLKINSSAKAQNSNIRKLIPRLCL
jgi:hypothetical protein